MSESNRREGREPLSARATEGALRPPATHLESLEERQWRAAIEQARARIAEEEREWELLLARAQAALENEEREWARLLERTRQTSSGAFAAQADTKSEQAVGARPVARERKQVPASLPW